jgi:hypothetical protein
MTTTQTKTFTRQFMYDNCGCYSKSELEACSFMKGEVVSLMDIVNSEIPIKDKYWFVCKKVATKEQNQRIAIDVAEMVLPIYEKRYPDDKRSREAIEAARQYLAGHIAIEQLIEKKMAAYAAAYTAAAAAYAAYTAAAYAAAYAADAAYAAYAAYAAAYAADAAYAAAAAEIKAQLQQYLITFCETP